MSKATARESMDRPIGCPKEGTFRPFVTEKKASRAFPPQGRFL
jgi:hypothetical protein